MKIAKTFEDIISKIRSKALFPLAVIITLKFVTTDHKFFT